MAYQPVDIGSAPNDGTGVPIRDAFDKCNDNFVELYAGLVGLLDFKGSTDCSANPNYPAASKGDTYLVSVAGKIGGASGVVVVAGDFYIATADNAGGTQAGVGTSWAVLEGNLAYAPVNKAGDAMTGDLIVPDEAYDATAWDASLEVPTKNAVRDKIEAIIAGSATVSDTAYGVGWDGDTTNAPSKNAVYDKIEALTAGVTSWKQAVRVATVAAGTLATSFENGDSVDGVTLATGDRILIKNQAAPAENGIYTVNASGAPTRATDADSAAEVLGAVMAVTEGVTVAKTQWQMTTAAPITLNTTGLVFELSGGANFGTTFPTTPATGRRFFRTDRGIEYYYDGTRWLSTQLFVAEVRHNDGNLPITGAVFMRGTNPWGGTYDIYVERVTMSTINTAATPASNYLTYQFSALDAAGTTNLGALLSSQNDTINQWFAKTATVGSVISSTYDAFMCTVAEAGAATTYAVGAVVYRLVG